MTTPLGAATRQDPGGPVDEGEEIADNSKSQTVTSKAIIPAEHIARGILVIRGQKVMLDADLARLYGVTTKRLNEQVKRNRDRFPADFMFQLIRQEKAEVVANCDHLQKLKYSPTMPYAFTEHGAIMLASVLNSDIAIHASIQVVRAFLRLREILVQHKQLSSRLDQLERKYDAQFKVVFDAIRELMSPKVPPRRRIGFMGEEAKRR